MIEKQQSQFRSVKKMKGSKGRRRKEPCKM